MEPVTSIVSAIFKVLQQIAKAEREARRNRTRCRDLACRAQVVSNVLRDARTRNDAAKRRMILCRLREALDDALKLVESCGQSDDSLWYRKISAILGSRARAARFDDVNKRINNCLLDLSATSSASIEKKIDRLSVASARDHQHHHPGASEPIKETKAGNVSQKGAMGQGGQNGGKGGKKRRGKKKTAAATASRPPPPVFPHAGVPRFHQNGHRCTVHHHHSMEEDPISCSVM